MDVPAQLVHGDLWPWHVLMGPHGDLRGILDFGAACISYAELDLAFLVKSYGYDALALLELSYPSSDFNRELVEAQVQLLELEWWRHSLQGGPLVDAL